MIKGPTVVFFWSISAKSHLEGAHKKAMELKSKQVLKKKSYGLQITESRISILNKTQSSKTTLKIHDLKDQAGNALGTKIELIIPIQTLNENYD